MKSLRTSNGHSLALGQLLGKGGEGNVYHVEGNPGLAAKIYTDGKSAERQAKISAMVDSGLHRASNFVAFPIELIVSQNGLFMGFTMRKVEGVKPIHELYGPGSRKAEFPKADFRFLVRTALNVARAVGSIHSGGCVIGDINHSGILVSDKATVTLIDSDSFQMRKGDLVFRCRVGVEEYTPPELQGMSLESVDRIPNHDNFGLAVMIFQLLFMGRHPFAGKFNGKGDMPIKKAIVEGRFAYSSRKAETGMEPPPYVPVLLDIPASVAAAFERAFQSVRRNSLPRPSASEWVKLLEATEQSLVTCGTDQAHHHPREAPRCPWCKLESGMGVSLFPLHHVTLSGTFNLASALAQINSIAEPSMPPDPLILMPQTSGLSISPEAKGVRNARIGRITSAVAAAMIGMFMTISGVGFGFLVLIGAAITFFVKGEGGTRLQTSRLDAENRWNVEKDIWTKRAGPSHFRSARDQLIELAKEHERLPVVERGKLNELEQQKRNLQLRKHLEAHRTARAKIANIGPGRKATLASYGIETAWDVSRNKIFGVPGFGPSLASDLLAWRSLVERKFVFNPSLPTDPAAIRRVRDEIANRRSQIEAKLQSGPTELRKITAQAVYLRGHPPEQMIAIYVAFKQAELDANA